MSLREWMPLIRKRISTAGSLPQIPYEDCGRYYNPASCRHKVWNQTTKLLKYNIFPAYNNGISCKKIADEHRIGVASVSATPPMMPCKPSQAKHTCPRIWDIDENKFTRREGNQRSFVILLVVKWRGSAAKRVFLHSLKAATKLKWSALI